MTIKGSFAASFIFCTDRASIVRVIKYGTFSDTQYSQNLGSKYTFKSLTDTLTDREVQKYLVDDSTKL